MSAVVERGESVLSWLLAPAFLGPLGVVCGENKKLPGSLFERGQSAVFSGFSVVGGCCLQRGDFGYRVSEECIHGKLFRRQTWLACHFL